MKTDETADGQGIGQGWFRLETQVSAAEGAWSGPALAYRYGPAGQPTLVVGVTPFGLHVVNHRPEPLSTDQQIDGLSNALTVAHRQYSERLVLCRTPHPVEDDRELMAWLEAQPEDDSGCTGPSLDP